VALLVWNNSVYLNATVQFWDDFTFQRDFIFSLKINEIAEDFPSLNYVIVQPWFDNWQNLILSIDEE